MRKVGNLFPSGRQKSGYMFYHKKLYIIVSPKIKMKPMCEWCGGEEYDIAILKGEKEEIICKSCFKDLVENNPDI